MTTAAMPMPVPMVQRKDATCFSAISVLTSSISCLTVAISVCVAIVFILCSKSAMRVSVSLLTIRHQPFRQRRFQFGYDRFESFSVGLLAVKSNSHNE